MTAAGSPFRALAGDRTLRRAGAALALYPLAEFGPWVAILVFAYAHGGATSAGVVSLALLVPTALAAPVAGPAIDRYGAGRVLVGGYAAQAVAMAAMPATCAGGVVFILLGVATSLVPALVAALLAGAARGLLEVCATTLLQRVTPTVLLARMLAFKESLTMAAWGLGSVLVPALIALGGVSAALIGVGAIAPLVVLARLRRLLLVDAAATVPVVAIALLRSMRLFRTLPAFELEAIARAGTDRAVSTGTRLVTEGEPAEGYFAIADGTVEVTRDGRHLATLGRGEGFGEIALLRNVRRTASVTATTDAALLAVERDAFIVAVTGHAESLRQARTIIGERLDDGHPGQPQVESATPR